MPVKVNQGVAVDAEYYYGISNTSVVKVRKRDDKQIARWKADKKNAKHRHFSHMNSGTVIDGMLYCAHSNNHLGLNSMEIWDVRGEKLKHVRTIKLNSGIKTHGNLTWADKGPDGAWWVCYVFYGKGTNEKTRLFKCELNDGGFVEQDQWFFPKEIVRNWGRWSCSGGSWGPDGLLYTTGHDHSRTYVLKIDPMGGLKYVKTEPGMGFYGQGIAWDRTNPNPVLWGIRKGKHISRTLIPGARKNDL